MPPAKALLLAVLLLACASAQAFTPCRNDAAYTPVAKRYTGGLLFKVEKCGQPVSYVFGTVHLDKPSIDQAAADAFKVLGSVQAAGFELPEVNDAINTDFLKDAFVTGKEHRLSAVLGPAYFARLTSELNFMAFFHGRHIRSDFLDRMQPWVAAIVLQAIDDPKGMVLDEKLWIAATLGGKQVFGLETPQEQAKIFSTLSDGLQIRMLKDEIDHYSEFLSEKDAMIKAYVHRDMREIDAIEEKSMDGGVDKELEAVIRDRLLVRRNLVMEKRLLPYLAKKSVLLSVGVMHLPGEEGLLRLLERDGYTITPMP